MVSLDRFETFRAVVDCGSLSAAADTLGQTRAVVSFNLKRLEAELGVSLLSRSTRRMALTDAGERFYQRCVKVLDEARLAIDDARAEHGELRGSLRVTTTQEYGLRQLVPALQAFARLHPALQVQLSTSSLHADLIGERFDVAIRLGRLEDSTHHAVQLASFEVLAVASPACLAALGEPPPTDLESLERLQNLGHSRLADSLPWQVRAPTAPCAATADRAIPCCWPTTPRPCAPLPRRPGYRRAAGLAGAGRLALRRTATPAGGPRVSAQGVHAVYPPTRHLPSKVRAFIDFLKTRLGHPDAG